MNIKDRMDSTDIYYVVYVAKKDTNNKFFTEGDKLTITPNYMLESSRTFTYTAGPVPTTNDPALAKSQMGKINVVPNPYFAHNKGEVNVYNRFVTFTNLPPVARIRIFTLTGEMVRDIQHNDATSSTVSLEQWDLRNANGLPVASGIYIVHIEVPDAGNRILKFAIIQPEERPTRI